MSSTEQIHSLLAELNRLTNNGKTAVAPAGSAAAAALDIPFEPTPVAVTPMEAQVVPPAPAPVAAPAATKKPPKKQAKTGQKWTSKQIPLPNGDTLEIRVAPKGYGCFGFVVGNEYVNFYGYRERMAALTEVFGPAFKALILDWMDANGLKNRAEVFA
jgi:hypothetical protein